MSHSTIVIGYGAYGLRLMRLVLSGAAARGALEWIEPSGVAAASERRLRGLAFIWVPDPLGQKDQAYQNLADNDPALELFDDLYDQIETLDVPPRELTRAVTAEVARERDRLLKLDDQNEDGSTRLGLDLIFLARPTTQQVLGQLRDLANAVLGRLGHDRLLYAGQQRTNMLLNALALFDFEDIWDPAMQRVRHSLAELIQQRKPQFEKGDPVLGRIYLFDKTSGKGTATSQLRLDQAALLLDLLLFENVRGALEVRELFGPKSPEQSPLCSIGLRCVERSSGRLLRLAAASYTRSWMRYLADESPTPEERAPALSAAIAAFLPDQLPATIQETAIRRLCDQEVMRIEKVMASARPGTSWAEDLHRLLQSDVAAALDALTSRLAACSRELEKHELRGARAALHAAVHQLLAARDRPFSLGAVVHQLEELQAELDRAKPTPVASATAALDAGAFDGVSQMYAETQFHSARQVEAAGFGARWWPCFAVLFGCAVTPFVLDAADQFLQNGPPTWLLSLSSATGCGAVAWAWGRKMVQRDVERLARRTRSFYDDPDQGRLAERLRAIADGRSVRFRLDQFVEALLATFKHQTLSLLSVEIRRMLDVLRVRQTEVRWLEKQCGAFLDLHGVAEINGSPAFRDNTVAQRWRRNMECTEDLRAILQGHKRDPEKFAALQQDQKLLLDWRDPHFDRFLHPTKMLDELAATFVDERLTTPELRDSRAREIEDFIDSTEGSSPDGFNWNAADGLPTLSRIAVQPRALEQSPKVYQTLVNAGFNGHIAASRGDRLYLIKARFGVDPALLGAGL